MLTQTITGAQERFWRTEIDDEQLADKQLAGWQVETQRRKRLRVHKFMLSGADVLTQLNEDKQRYAELVGQYDLDLRNAG